MKELAISGGGVRGFGYIGCLHHLYECGELDDLERISCTSIGAWLGAGIAMGYTPRDLGDRFFEVDMVSDLDFSGAVERKSLTRGDEFRRIIADFVHEKCPAGITLAQLHRESGIDLIMTTVCVTTGCAVYLDHLTFPDLDLVDAIVMSSAVPFLVPPVRHGDKVYVDGGIVDNNPVNVLGPEAWSIVPDPDETLDDCETLQGYVSGIFRAVYNNIGPRPRTTHRVIKVRTDAPVLSPAVDKDLKYQLLQDGIRSARRYLARVRTVRGIRERAPVKRKRDPGKDQLCDLD